MSETETPADPVVLELGHVPLVARELKLEEWQVKHTIELLAGDNTVPFITRYRKEMTGNLDEEQIRAIQQQHDHWTKLAARREAILESLRKLGKLAPELAGALRAATALTTLEDLYAPYRPKRRTRATLAAERGLTPLADQLLEQPEGTTPPALAVPFVDPEKGVETAEAALQGAADILAERFSDDARVREFTRTHYKKQGVMVSVKSRKAPEGPSDYQIYFDFKEAVSVIPAHRILAINRGEKENQLSVKIAVPPDPVLAHLAHLFLRIKDYAAFLNPVFADSLDRLLGPSLEREIRSLLTAYAEEEAIRVFADNLRPLLLQRPLKGKRLLALDPGFRTGCKVAVLDKLGNLVEHCAIFPHPPRKEWDQSLAVLLALIARHELELIVIGNGTASRETEALVAAAIKRATAAGVRISYTIASEAGASVYSASPVAAEEFPDLDATVRGAISIGRRVVDPLAELVKIEPRSLGVGQYQHDVDPKKLDETLSAVVESCVNQVGVDVNTASVSLLTYVSGLSKNIAKEIYTARSKKQRFTSREDLKAVKGIGEKVFTQCAGFLRVSGGTHPLDNSWIHPESYPATRKLLDQLSFPLTDFPDPEKRKFLSRRLASLNLDQVAKELGVGEFTLKDIVENLKRLGRDPRDEAPAPIFRQDVLKIEDLAAGMLLKGTVRNVVDFGAFVDIGVKHDGLVHLSQLSDRYISHPSEAVKVGDIVDVRVLEVDHGRERIQLTMKSPALPAAPKPRPAKIPAPCPVSPRPVKTPPSPSPKPAGPFTAQKAAEELRRKWGLR